MLATEAFGQKKGFSIGTMPSWVVPATWADAPKDSSGRVGGYYYLVYDQQIHAEQQQVFTQTAIKVKNEKGLSYASVIEESYDPTFQKITFHSLYVQRGNTKIDHLKASNFQILQREENLSRASYDGSLTAMVNLKDVKPGDIVVYSLTVTGFNPVFKNHFFRKLQFNFGVPIHLVQYRLLASVNRKLYFKDSNQPPSAEKSSSGNTSIYQWKAERVGAYNSEDRTPSWVNPYMRVEVTDFKDWNELSEWALELFKVQRKPSPKLQAFMDSIRALPTVEHQVIAAIRTIQDKVRYFSLVDGMSSYQPHPPSEVFSNRYGDCKDKSLLLAQVLSSVGVKSAPVLVTTDVGPALKELLPSPWNFNHCIVRFELQDSAYYVDPTISFQRGGLEQLSTPAYHFGVVADPALPGLTEIANPPVNKSLIRAVEDFEFLAVPGPATLHVETVYSGAEANGVRDGFKAAAQEDTDQNYRDFYANEYPNITLTKSIRYEDDTIKNTVRVIEDYQVPDFWLYDSTARQYKAEMYGRVIGGYLSKPSTKSRKMPFTITYPLDIELVTNVHLPETWNVTDAEKTIQGPGFVFKASTFYHDRLIRNRFTYLHTTNAVEPGKTSEFANKIDDIYNELTFVLNYTPGEVVESGTGGNWKAFVSILVLAAAFGLLGWWAYQYDPPARPHGNVYRNIGGWLILPVIGFGVAPFRLIISLMMQDYFNDEVLRTLANPVASGALGVFIFSEFAGNICLLVLSVLTFALLVTRRTSAPIFVTITYGFGIVLMTSDGLVAQSFFDQPMTPDDVRSLLITFISAAIWIPYMFLSERAHGTFVNRLNA